MEASGRGGGIRATKMGGGERRVGKCGVVLAKVDSDVEIL